MPRIANRNSHRLALSAGSIAIALLLPGCANDNRSANQDAATTKSEAVSRAAAAASRPTNASPTAAPARPNPTANPGSLTNPIPRENLGGQSVPDKIWPDFAWAKPGETIDIYGVWDSYKQDSYGTFTVLVTDPAAGSPQYKPKASSADPTRFPHMIIPVRIEEPGKLGDPSYPPYDAQLQLTAPESNLSSKALVHVSPQMPTLRIAPKRDDKLAGTSSRRGDSKPAGGQKTAAPSRTLEPLASSVTLGQDVEYKFTASNEAQPNRIQFAFYIVRVCNSVPTPDCLLKSPVSPSLGQSFWLPAGDHSFKIVVPTLAEIKLGKDEQIYLRAYVVDLDNNLTFSKDVTLKN